MQDLILTQIHVSQLQSLIAESVDNAIKIRDNQANPALDDRLLNVNEVCSLLQISKVTLHVWKKKGLLPFLRISRKIYFKKSEIIEAMKSIPAHGNRRNKM